MKLNSNVLAMNSVRSLIATGLKQSQAMQRLSSGKKINTAADNAAGFAISEKMAMQVSRLSVASKNSLNGVSLIQTAEGALNEVHSMLQRMRELAVQAANDTNQLEDRDAMQKEINQLTSEVNRIGETTEFNKLKLFTPDNEDGTSKPNMSIPIQAGANAKQMVDIEFKEVSGTILNISGTTPNSNGNVPQTMYSDIPLTNQTVKERDGANVPLRDVNGNFIYKKEYALDIRNNSNASAAITAYDRAISQISELRSSLGASQNRFEHTIASLDVAVENVTGAMSRIQDSDMAEEMTEFTKFNILQQSGTAMLAQANQLPQMVLKLLES